MNSVLATGYDLKVFFNRGRQAASRGEHAGRAGVHRRPTRSATRQRGAPGRPGSGFVGTHDPAPARDVVRAVRVSAGLRRGRGQSGAARVGRSGRIRTWSSAGVPLIRTPRTLPRVLGPAEALALLTTLRPARDRAMLLGGLRRYEVLGLHLKDIQLADRRLFIAEGKGGHQRIVPVSSSFFATLGQYLDSERGSPDTDAVFVVLKVRTAAGRCPRQGSMRSCAARRPAPD